MRKSVLAAAAAVSMIGVSSGALAQSAAPLSVAANVRAGADMEEASDYRGGVIIPGLIVLVIGVLVYVLTKSDEPTSP
jgi:sugar phosphate permease